MATKSPEGSFEWYRQVFSSILNDDMHQYQNLNDTYQLLLNFGEDFSLEDVKNREFAMKISKYAHEMAQLEATHTEDDNLFDLYWDMLLFEARNYQVDSGLLYLEKNRPQKEKFYEPRREVFEKFNIVQSFQDLMDDKLDFLSVSMPPGTGKQLADDTPILTTDGWKNHGDLKVGDKVFGIDGKAKRVLQVFPKSYNDCLVTFTNGEQIQCHENHEWLIYDRRCGRQRIIETKKLFDRKLDIGEDGKRGHRYLFQIPLKKAFIGETKELPVQPYTLGVWLGNGRNNNPDICGAKEDIEKEIISICEEGYSISWESTHKDTLVEYVGIRGLRESLQKCGMCHSRRRTKKHIPEIYFSASMAQRLNLLAGLIDTDGCLTKNNRYHFSTIEEQLKDDFIKLISTFGWRCSVTFEEPRESSSGIIGRNRVYTIGFNPTFHIPCRIERKQLFCFSKQRKVAIKSVERVTPKRGNCIEVEDGIYCAGNTMIPTHNSTTEIFFLALVGGWYPNDFNLSSAHSSILTRSLYDGIAEIINDPDYSWHEIFPKLKLQSTNAKETTINLERAGRFKTWTFRSIDGSLTGATRCNRFLTADDLVSGIEEALNKNRLETLWTKVVNDLLSRQLDGCKRIFFATRWSAHDPIGRMWDMYEGTSKARFIVAPALDENGESNFQYKINGFSTEYFKEQMELMDEISANALYMQKPVEREGILLPASELRRFFLTKEQVPLDRSVFDVFPERQPDAIWAVCDTKDKGTDFESLPIAYQYGEDFYILDVLYDDSTDYEYLDQKTADILIKHNPHIIRFESNSAGGRVSYNVGKLIEGKCSTVIEEKYTTQNKETKILVNSGWIKQHCIFLEPSLYMPKSDYGKFMGNVTSYTTKAKTVHDDGIDTLAILSETVREKYGTNRRKTRIMKSPI